MKVKALMMVFFISLPALLFAQTTTIQPPGCGDCQVYDVPFDDNISFLVAAAIFYGVIRIWAYKKVEKIKKPYY